MSDNRVTGGTNKLLGGVGNVKRKKRGANHVFILNTLVALLFLHEYYRRAIDRFIITDSLYS